MTPAMLKEIHIKELAEAVIENIACNGRKAEKGPMK